jgi:hypothetical protein
MDLSSYVSRLISTVDSSFNWAITVVVIFTAGYLAVSLIAHFIRKS